MERSMKTSQCPGLTMGGSESDVLETLPGFPEGTSGLEEFKPHPCSFSSSVLTTNESTVFHRTDQKGERLIITQQAERLLQTMFIGNFRGGNFITRCLEGPGPGPGKLWDFLQGTNCWEHTD